MHVPEEMLRSVAYLAYRDRSGEYRFAGSVFFIGKPKPGENRCERVWAVTALHVIEGLFRNVTKEVLLRVNVKAGGVEWISTTLDHWYWLEGGLVDVAVCEMGIPERLDQRVVPFTMCSPVSGLEGLAYSLGEEAFIIGLYLRQPGTDRNVPIVRVGNVACLQPQSIRTTQHGEIRGILVEARSFGGLSGSPVFASLPLMYVKDGKLNFRTGDVLKLIGLVHGHHDLDVKKQFS